MPSTATVTTRRPAVLIATTEAPRSICDMTQPPKISPLRLASAGMAMVRYTNSPLGCLCPCSSLDVISISCRFLLFTDAKTQSIKQKQPPRLGVSASKSSRICRRCAFEVLQFAQRYGEHGEVG